MWYAARITTAAADAPVTVAEAKARLSVDFADDDAILGDMIDEVTDRIERHCSIRIMPQTVSLKCDSFSDFSDIPEGPLADNAVQSISYVDGDGVTQTLDSSVYELRVNGLEARIVPAFGQAWPATRTGSRITVSLQAGYEALPPEIRTALFIGVAELYENRRDKEAADWTLFDHLLVNFRR